MNMLELEQKIKELVGSEGLKRLKEGSYTLEDVEAGKKVLSEKLKPTVYATSKGSHDYTSAKFFGDLVFMTDEKLDKFNTSHMTRCLKPFVNQSHPEDYLLLSGLPTLNAVATAMFVAKHGRLNLLLFDNGRYVERRIVLKE